MLLKLRGHGWGPWPFVDSWNVGVSKEVLAEVLKIKIILEWKCTIGIVTWRENKEHWACGYHVNGKEAWSFHWSMDSTTQDHIGMKFHVSVFLIIQVCVLIILLTETPSTSALFWVSVSSSFSNLALYGSWLLCSYSIIKQQNTI